MVACKFAKENYCGSWYFYEDLEGWPPPPRLTRVIKFQLQKAASRWRCWNVNRRKSLWIFNKHPEVARHPVLFPCPVESFNYSRLTSTSNWPVLRPLPNFLPTRGNEGNRYALGTWPLIPKFLSFPRRERYFIISRNISSPLLLSLLLRNFREISFFFFFFLFRCGTLSSRYYVYYNINRDRECNGWIVYFTN